jgi:hypothetical protein
MRSGTTMPMKMQCHSGFCQIIPLGLLKKTAVAPAHDTLTREEGGVRPKEGKHPILCRRCGQEITQAEYAVTINGRHEHTFTNPAGVTYQIGCFSAAGGCVVFGPPVFEYTWFPGFAWAVGLCSNCYLHMGWLYQSPETNFFGLITTNLVKTIRPH